MGDHFVLLVDRLLTESTLEAAIFNTKNPQILAVEKKEQECCKKLVECKICHDDDQYSNMETPCSCSGTLKYAHRRCVQRWCNEKGDTMCEICHQQFKPGYTVPPLFQFGRIPVHLRGNWEIATRDINSPRIIAMVSTEPNLVDHHHLNNDEPDYSASSSTTLACCRSVAIIFVILLILRHTLPLVISGHRSDYSFPFLTSVGIVVAIYVMVRAVTRRRPNQQVLPLNSLQPR